MICVFLFGGLLKEWKYVRSASEASPGGNCSGQDAVTSGGQESLARYPAQPLPEQPLATLNQVPPGPVQMWRILVLILPAFWDSCVAQMFCRV